MAGRQFTATALFTFVLSLLANASDSASLYTHGSAWLPSGHSLQPALSQKATNGESLLGTLSAEKLPGWLDGDGTPMPHGRPWGSKTSQNTNPYKDPPNTGMTRFYEFSVSKQTISPDGVNKSAIVINGAFPGPIIEANWGDWIQVTVHNAIDEGTSLHWHGLLQNETPWFDGVPSISQCPIAPGTTFTYRFRADLYGSSWYHSHYSAQTAGGLLGPMIIYGPHDNAEYDVDIGPILITDWFHRDYFSLLKDVMSPTSAQTFPPASQNSLINGKMNYPCPANGTACTPNAGVAKFRFESGKSYRLRLINAGAEALQKFSIDDHEITVIANDFVPVVPYKVNAVTLGVGQRTDIIVKATGKPTDAVWMRSTVSIVTQGGCALSDGISPEAVAAIYYQNTDTTTIPTTKTKVTQVELMSCSNDALTQTVPYLEITPGSKSVTTRQIDITFRSNGTHTLWYMNNSTFRADYNNPLLLEALMGKFDFKPESNVLDIGSNSSSARIVVYNHDFLAGVHPMHLHGHNMYILAEGFGEWNGTITNGRNPLRRDTHILARAKDENTPAYMVMQIDADNAGIWPFHCHVSWHNSGGFYINLLEDSDAIKEKHLPSTLAQTCRDWTAWTGNHVVSQIDAGI